MRYTTVLEQGPNNWSAYVPDVPGCVSTGRTRADVEANIRETLLLHLGSLLADGELLPPAGAWTTEVAFDEATLQAAAVRLARQAS